MGQSQGADALTLGLELLANLGDYGIVGFPLPPPVLTIEVISEPFA